MPELLTLAEQIGSLAARCVDPPAAQILRDAEGMLLEADRESALREVADRAELARLITDTCHKPGHAVVLLDLLGQTWVGYAGTAGAYVARPPSRHHVLEAITDSVVELWHPVADLDAVRFPVLALHIPSPPPLDDRSSAAGVTR